MEYQQELKSLRSELTMSKDNCEAILKGACSGFLAKYQPTMAFNKNYMERDLRKIRMQIDVYTEHTDETLMKYPSMRKLSSLFHAIIQSQAMLLSITTSFTMEYLQNKESYENHLSEYTRKIYEKCSTCEGALYKSKLDHVRDEVELKFKNVYSYFIHDIDEINKLEEEATLIFRKKNLGLQEINEEEYLGRLERMGEHMANTMMQVEQSLSSINSFNDKLDQLKDYQDSVESSSRNQHHSLFNPKLFMVKLSKHFHEQIKNVEAKLDSIKKYFIFTVEHGSQTNETGGYVSMETINQLKQEILNLEVDNKQLGIYKGSLEQQLGETRARIKFLEDTKNGMELDRKEFQEKIIYLELEAEKLRRNSSSIRKPSFQILKTGNESEVSSRFNNLNEVSKLTENDHANSSEEDNELRTESQDGNENEYELERGKNGKEKRKSIKLKITLEAGKQSKKPDPFDKKIIKMTEKSALKKKAKNQMPQKSFKNLQSFKEISNVKGGRSKNFHKNIMGRNRKLKIMAEFSLSIPFSNAPTLHKSIRNQSRENFGRKKENLLESDKIISNQSSRNTSMQNSMHQNQSNNPKESSSAKYRSSYKASADKNDKRKASIQSQDLIGNFYQFYRTKSGLKISEVMDFDKLKQKIESIFECDEEHYQNQTPPQKLAKANRNDSLNYAKSQRGESIISMEKDVFTRNSTIESGNMKEKFNETMMPYLEQYQFKGKLKDDEANKQDLSNTLRERQSNVKLKKIQSLSKQFTNPTLGSTQSNRFSSILEVLPSLPKKNKRGQQNSFCKFNETMLGGECEWAMESKFVKKDIEIIYKTIENAYQVNKLMESATKKQSHVSVNSQDLMTPLEIFYLNEFFAVMANLHLKSSVGYEKVKLFLLSPYDTVVSQMNDLKILKASSNSSIMREAVQKILFIHRRCTVKSQLCKHLKYLMKKVKFFLTLDE